MSARAANILKKRKRSRICCSSIVRRLMGSEMKFREFFIVWRDIFSFISSEIEADITKINNKTRQQTPALPLCHNTTACRAEVKVRMPLQHDPAEPAQYPCVTRRRETFKKPVPFKCIALTTASRSRKRHCVLMNNKGFKAMTFNLEYACHREYAKTC